MDIDRAKLFVGGISRETSEEALRAHFSKYGPVSGSHVAKERYTQNSRGFGFVWFSDSAFADKALNDSHVILGRTVEVKKAIPRSEQLQNHKHQPLSTIQQKSTDNSDNGFKTKKIFVGGLASSLTEEQFKNYFLRFGEIADVVVMQDSSTNRPRGFGFVTFDSEESVDKVMLNTFHELNGRLVEVKKAVPKEGLNSANNSVRGPFTRRFHQENYLTPYGHGYEIHPSYVPFPWYNGFGGYSYGNVIYSGYPTFNNGVPAIPPRGPLSSSVMIGPMMCPSPYNCPVYPPYVNGYVSVMNMMPSAHTEIVGPSENAKFTKNCGVDGSLQYNGALIPAEGVKSGS